MKRVLIISALLFIVAFLGLGCGKGNSSSPYSATQGATVSAPGDATFDSAGGGFIVNFPVSVHKGGELQNDIALKTWVYWVGTASDYAVITSAKDLVGDTDDFDDWDDDGLPLYVTDEHGRADVLIIIPGGFAGVIALTFDIGVSQAESKITVNPKGGTCFDGEDNNNDGNIDAFDPACADNPFGTEPTSTSEKSLN